MDNVKDFFSRYTWVDYLAIIVALRGAFVGFRGGLFPELLRIAAYFVTVVVTFRFYEPLAQTLTVRTFMNLTTATAVAVSTLLSASFLISKLVTVFLLKLLKTGEGGFFYRLMGLAVGVCRWLILLSLIFNLIDHLPMAPLQKDIHKHSVSGPSISKIAPLLFGFLSNLSPQLAVEDKAK